MIIDVVFRKQFSVQDIKKNTKQYWKLDTSEVWKSTYFIKPILLTIYPTTIHITSFDESEAVIKLINGYLAALFSNTIIAISCSTIIDPFLNIKNVSVINITPNKSDIKKE